MSEEKKNSIRDIFERYVKNPDAEKGNLLSALNKQRDSWHGERKMTQDRNWRDEVAFYTGNHYVRDTGASGGAYRVRLRENHINNVTSRMLSIVSQNLPIVRVFPASDSHDDVEAAEKTEKYGKYFHRTKKIEQVYLKKIKYGLIFGNGFLVRSYDPDAGGKMELQASETKSGDPEIHSYRGDIKLTVADPFKLVFRPGIEEIDDMYDFFHEEPVSRFGLEATYGDVEAEGAKGLNAYTGEIRKDNDLVMLHHYYHKPTNWFDKGMYACWAGKTLCKAVTFPHNDGLLPVQHLPFDKPPLGFYGVSSIEQVMDLQEQLNRAASYIVEARNLVARPRVMISNEAKVPSQMITDRPGDIIRYAMAGGAPKFEVPNFNFAEMAAHKADLRNALSSVMGMSGASRGEIPQATKTALALQLVLEQDRSQYAPFIKAINQGLQDTYMGIFGLAAQHFTEEDPRVVKIEGPFSSSFTFHGGMVPNPLDVWLEDTNPLGWTAAGRIEQVGSLIEKGLIKDRNQALEMLKLSSPDPAYESVKINTQCQQKENDLLSKGQTVPIGTEDDDEVHLDEITKVIASFEFRKRDKRAQEAFIDHAEQHKTRRSAAMQPPPGAEGPGGPGGEMKLGGPKPAPMGGSLAPADTGSNMEKLLSSSRGG